MRRFSLLAIALSFCSGCFPGVGPITSSQQLESTLRRSVAMGDEPVVMFARVEWYPNSETFVLMKAPKFESGVVVLQPSRLLFVQWDQKANRYLLARDIEYAKATDVRRRVWGAGQRIVVETSSTVDSFTATTANGAAVNHSRLNEMIAYLRTKIPSSDAHKDH